MVTRFERQLWNSGTFAIRNTKQKQETKQNKTRNKTKRNTGSQRKQNQKQRKTETERWRTCTFGYSREVTKKTSKKDVNVG